MFWIETKDGDPRAREIFDRHYSKYTYKDGRMEDPTYRQRNLFCGPGEKLVLVTPEYDALFVWRKVNKCASGQVGINCAVFRNESNLLASELILEAEQIALNRWPAARLYTFVAPTKIRSVNPGYCFKVAGWKTCGITKRRKLLILAKETEAA